MPPPPSLLVGGVLGLLVILAVGYWQLIIAEGVYLGQWMVTFLYDLTATRYDQIKGFDRDFETRFLGRPLAAAFGDGRAPLVLDIGTGTGRLPQALFQQPTFQGKIIGIDGSHGMLLRAAEKLKGYEERLSLLWCSGTPLPFPDSTFDAVTMLEMLEFTPDPCRQISEAVRVLHPGGVLLTTRRRGFDARLMPGKTHSQKAFAEVLSSAGLAHVTIQAWQVDYDLAWGKRPGIGAGGARPLVEVLLCPLCLARALERKRDHLACHSCGGRFSVSNEVIDLRTHLR